MVFHISILFGIPLLLTTGNKLAIIILQLLRENNMSEIVLCKDCVHKFVKWYDYAFSLINPSAFTLCKKGWTEPAEKIDPVSGKENKGYYVSAAIERARLSKERCGPTGKYWEPKNKKHLFTYLKRI